MSSFRLTPRKLLFFTLIVAFIAVAALVVGVYFTMSKKETVRIESQPAAAASETVELLTPNGGSAIVQGVAIQASGATPASEPEETAASDAAEETEQAAPPPRRNNSRATNSNHNTPPPPPDAAQERPLQPINVPPSNNTAPTPTAPITERKEPAKKKEVIDNLF